MIFFTYKRCLTILFVLLLAIPPNLSATDTEEHLNFFNMSWASALVVVSIIAGLAGLVKLVVYEFSSRKDRSSFEISEISQIKDLENKLNLLEKDLEYLKESVHTNKESIQNAINLINASIGDIRKLLYSYITNKSNLSD